MKLFPIDKNLLASAITSIASLSIACSSVSAEPLAPTLGIAALNLPNCVGTCYNLSIQTLPGSNGIQPSTELRFGVAIDLDRTESDRLKAAAARLPAERKLIKQAFIDELKRELTSALDRQQYERARILAIQLAPNLGYKDYRQYLSTITGGSFPNP